MRDSLCRRSLLCLGLLAVGARPAAALSFLGAKVDPPAIAPGGHGTLRVLALGGGDNDPRIQVCAPAGLTFGTPSNDPVNVPPLSGAPAGNCITVAAQGRSSAPSQVYSVDFPFTLSPGFVSPGAPSTSTFSIQLASSGSNTTTAHLPLVLAGAGPVLAIASEVHSFLDFRFGGLCLVGADCWFDIDVTNDGDATAAGWEVTDALPFPCTSVTALAMGGLPADPPARFAASSSLAVPGRPLAPGATEKLTVDCTAPDANFATFTNTAQLHFAGATQSSTVSVEVLPVPPPSAAAPVVAQAGGAADLFTRTYFFGAPDDRVPEVGVGGAVVFVTTVANLGGASTPDAVGVAGLLDPNSVGDALSLVASSAYLLRADGSTSARLPCAGKPGVPEYCQTPAALEPGETFVVVRWIRAAAQPPGGGLVVRDAAAGTGAAGSPFATGNSLALAVLQSLAGPCVASGSHLCLQEGRFDAAAVWMTVGAPSGGAVAHAVPLAPAGVGAPDSGYFWFFDPANVELVAKVLDGRAVNQDFWVFYGALSNVEYALTVRDTLTGAVKSYFNPDGRLASVADTSAFGPFPPVQTAFSQGDPVCPVLASAATTAGCSADATHLCLLGNRFKVAVAWQAAGGQRGSGMAVPITTDSGYFWFFSGPNVELILKVLDGTAFNGRYWVFYGALSDVRYTITVTDTTTGRVKRYVNPQGRLASVADTSAF
jgi:uncharacterized protein DUF11